MTFQTASEPDEAQTLKTGLTQSGGACEEIAWFFVQIYSL
jgi:hypothetical protein